MAQFKMREEANSKSNLAFSKLASLTNKAAVGIEFYNKMAGISNAFFGTDLVQIDGKLGTIAKRELEKSGIQLEKERLDRDKKVLEVEKERRALLEDEKKSRQADEDRAIKQVSDRREEERKERKAQLEEEGKSISNKKLVEETKKIKFENDKQRAKTEEKESKSRKSDDAGDKPNPSGSVNSQSSNKQETQNAVTNNKSESTPSSKTSESYNSFKSDSNNNKFKEDGVVWVMAEWGPHPLTGIEDYSSAGELWVEG
jgi:hypothetical protein